MSFGAKYADFNAAMTQLASTSGGICTVQSLSQKSSELNRDIHFLEIKAPGAPADHPAALILGGVHARELAPPAAVLQFAINVVRKYVSGDVEYPPFTDPQGNVPYPRWTKSNKEVRKIVDATTLLVVPVVNPDGRDHVLIANDASWRGNRNLAACARFGVDLNRNFDIGWDAHKYYTAGDETKIVPAATNPNCTGDDFRGPGAGSEKETKGIQDLIDARDVRCFIDVHSYGRRILTPWGLAGNQSADSQQSFLNHTLDRPGGSGRSVLNGAYREFLPDARPDQVLTTHGQLAERMRQAILDQAGANATAKLRSTYKRYQIPELYKELLGLPNILPVPGSSADYALSRQLKPGEPAPAFAFAMECGWIAGAFSGGDPVDEGGFVPRNAIKYQKIEREVHAALWALLSGMVSATSSGKKKGK